MHSTSGSSASNASADTSDTSGLGETARTMQPSRVSAPPLGGGDIELGNGIDGRDPSKRNCWDAARAVLREIDGVKSGEICKILSITSSNLWVMLHRSRAKLRKCLDANWFQRNSKES